MTQMKLFTVRYAKIEDAYRNTKTHYDIFLIREENNNLKIDYSILMFMDDGIKPYVYWFETNLPKNKKFYVRNLFVGILPSGEIYYRELNYNGIINFVIFRSDGFVLCASIIKMQNPGNEMTPFIPRNRMEEILLEDIEANNVMIDNYS